MQDIRFARSVDDVRIAYAMHGSGPPLLIDKSWLSHLQFDWQSPVWRHYLVELGRIATVIRYDERGYGLSDRKVSDHSLEARVADLEAVADDAGIERFALLAMAQGGPVAIEYAARHPERLTRLIFYGSFAGDQLATAPEDVEVYETMGAMIRVGWSRPTSEFRRVFTSMMIPGGTEEQMRWIDDLQRMAVDAETALLARSHRLVTDSSARLSELQLPTLVLHSRGDRAQPYQRGRDLAARISGARLVALESINHIVLADEPAWPVFLREVTQFLAPDRVTAAAGGSRRRSFDAVAARIGHPPAGRRGPRQRRHRSRAGAVGPHGRAAPSERVCEARSAGPQRAHGGRRAAARPRLTSLGGLRVTRHRMNQVLAHIDLRGPKPSAATRNGLSKPEIIPLPATPRHTRDQTTSSFPQPPRKPGRLRSASA